MKILSRMTLALVAGSLAGALPAQAAVGVGAAPRAAVAAAYGEDWQRGREPSWDGRGGGQSGWGRASDRGNDGADWRDDRRREDSYREDSYRAGAWRGRDGRYYCRRPDGTTGLLIGGAAGALIGRGVAGPSGDRTLGAILGAAGGALLGRAIDRDSSRCR